MRIALTIYWLVATGVLGAVFFKTGKRDLLWFIAVCALFAARSIFKMLKP